MSVLHHLWITPDDGPGWVEFLRALEAGDSVVLLDRAARALHDDARWIERYPQVSWSLPICERAFDAPLAPVGVVEITPQDWWQMIMSHPVLLEWN